MSRYKCKCGYVSRKAEERDLHSQICGKGELSPAAWFGALSKQQKALAKKHGTPAEFSTACYDSVPSFISMDEAAAAIDKYNREWAAAAVERAEHCSAEPSWAAFVARLKIEAPELQPDENDEQWKNLHAVYIMGYSACLEILKKELNYKGQP